MKVLFFDLEYASCKDGDKKICEFGYVVTNENFKVLEKGNYIINPNISRGEWDYRALRDILTRTRDEYERCLNFKYHHLKISRLITESDYIFGHTVAGDVVAINQNYARYSIDYLNFEFYDVRELYKKFAGTSANVGVSGILKEMGINGLYNAHDALADAYNTMLILKSIIQKSSTTFVDLMNENAFLKDKTQNGIVESLELAEKALRETLNGDGTNFLYTEVNIKRYRQFIRYSWAHKKRFGNLKNLKVGISKNYLYNHYAQALNLTNLIFNEGGTVKRDENALPNIFVTFAETSELIEGAQEELAKIRKAIEDGRNIKIISFDEFLNMLKITNEELEKMPIPSFEFLLKKKKKPAKKLKPLNKKRVEGESFKTRVLYSESTGGASITEILSNQGIAL